MMKTLELNDLLTNKLNRLSKRAGELSYLGINPNDVADRPMVAVVGTRKPTPYGKDLTERIVSELVREGVVIVSGLAFGIDIIAHQTTLRENSTTIAILPSGLNNIYPATHRNIAHDILADGALISEFAPDHQPRAAEFLARNRIIAALADAVFIPEAAERSGSLNTAGHAHKMGIPVFAAPGRSIDLMSSGTNHLIRTGKATMATTANDILKTLNIKSPAVKPAPQGNDTHETSVLIAIQSGIQDTTLLQKELEMDIIKLQSVLTILEINGQVEQNEIGQWGLV